MGSKIASSVLRSSHLVPLLVILPVFEKFSGEAALHHSGWRENDAGSDVVEVVDALQVGDVLEDERVVDGDLTPDAIVHRVHERLE